MAGFFLERVINNKTKNFMKFLYAIYQNFQSVKIVKKDFLSFGCHLYLNASFVGKILKDPLKLFGLRKAICCVQLA